MAIEDPRLIGVEHEYRVLDPTGQQVDFRVLIKTLTIPGGGLDPGDENAHHLPTGVLLTADGKEAEVATPPVAVDADGLRTASAWSELAEDELLRVLPAGFGIEGFSTHLNVAVRGDVVEVTRRFAEHFALPMSLLVDHADSPGLLVRPRRGRLELGGDFIEGPQLRAALDFAIAAAECCERDDLPAMEPLELTRAKDRPGWFFAHRAASADVLVSAREYVGLPGVDTPLPRDHVTGQDGRAVTLESPFAEVMARTDVAAITWAAVAFRIAPEHHVVVPRASLRAFLDGDETEARVVRGKFDPKWVIPDEPQVPQRWWRERRVELIGAIVGAAAVGVAYAVIR